MLKTKQKKSKLANRLFSVIGLSIGAVILAVLIVYVVRTTDLQTLMRKVKPGWLVCAALCVPTAQSIDAIILYGMGKSAGCPVRLAGCFDAAFIGEFYYKLGPAGAPVQLKLIYDAGMPITNAASLFTWKLVANTMCYTACGAAALVFVLLVRQEHLGTAAIVGIVLLIALYVSLCSLAIIMSRRPAGLMRLIRRVLTALSKKIKFLAREGMVDAGMRKVQEFSSQLRAFDGNHRLFVWLYSFMLLELLCLFAIPYFIYRGLGLGKESLLTMILLQAMVLLVSRILFFLPGNVGGAEGSFYLFMGPVFGEHLALGLVLWRMASMMEVLAIGGLWSVVRFARRSIHQSRDAGK